MYLPEHLERKKRNDKSSFVQKPISGTIHIEGKIEKDIDMKNQFKIENISEPISIREPASMLYVNNKLNDPSVIKKLHTC